MVIISIYRKNSPLSFLSYMELKVPPLRIELGTYRFSIHKLLSEDFKKQSETWQMPEMWRINSRNLELMFFLINKYSFSPSRFLGLIFVKTAF